MKGILVHFSINYDHYLFVSFPHYNQTRLGVSTPLSDLLIFNTSK